MEALYSQITDYLREAGKELLGLQGKVADIGVAKKYLTEKDLEIERRLTELVLDEHPDHVIYAEEEHDVFTNAKDIWVIDPISGTKTFIAGRPHYALVVSHVHDGQTLFAAVYDPSADELFTAHAGKGAYLNGKPVHVSSDTERILLRISSAQVDSPEALVLQQATGSLQPSQIDASFALNYCWVAAGRFDGIVALSKDTFPEFAGDLIIREAGGKFTNIDGGSIQPNDRIFIGGNPQMYDELMRRCREELSKAG